jgi:hypothetical protein
MRRAPSLTSISANDNPGLLQHYRPDQDIRGGSPGRRELPGAAIRASSNYPAVSDNVRSIREQSIRFEGRLSARLVEPPRVAPRKIFPTSTWLIRMPLTLTFLASDRGPDRLCRRIARGGSGTRRDFHHKLLRANRKPDAGLRAAFMPIGECDLATLGGDHRTDNRQPEPHSASAAPVARGIDPAERLTQPTELVGRYAWPIIAYIDPPSPRSSHSDNTTRVTWRCPLLIRLVSVRRTASGATTTGERISNTSTAHNSAPISVTTS